MATGTGPTGTDSGPSTHRTAAIIAAAVRADVLCFFSLDTFSSSPFWGQYKGKGPKKQSPFL